MSAPAIHPALLAGSGRGWAIFEATSSSWGTTYQLQREDDADGAPQLDDDCDAWELVVFGAMHGDPECLNVLVFLADVENDSRKEYDEIVRWVFRDRSPRLAG